jgi:hypothetical protein
MTGDPRINPLTGRPISNADILDDPEFKGFATRVIGELVPKIEASGVTLTLVPTGDIDVKFAVELGVSIMLNKPIIAMIEEGVPIPDKLAAVCDHVLVMPKDWRTNRAFQQKMMESLTEVKTRTLGA